MYKKEFLEKIKKFDGKLGMWQIAFDKLYSMIEFEFETIN